MLSPNSILSQGRYRIVRSFWSSDTASFYDAHDNLFGQNVVIYEGADPRSAGPTIFDRDADSRRFAARFNRLKSFGHQALVGVRDHFYSSDQKYIVSNETDGVSIAQSIGLDRVRMTESRVVRMIEDLLDAFQHIAYTDTSVTYLGANAANIRVTAGGEIRFSYFGMPEPRAGTTTAKIDISKDEFAFLPLENIWQSLDLASQKAIANSYEERSFETLVSPPDFRSDIFTLGAICYYVLTGKVPVEALERSVEILDGNPDPLAPPNLLNDFLSNEVSGIVMRAMRLKREDRFENFETVKRQLRTVEPGPEARPVPFIELSDDIDLLEIPGLTSVDAISVQHRVATVPAIRMASTATQTVVSSPRQPDPPVSQSAVQPIVIVEPTPVAPIFTDPINVAVDNDIHGLSGNVEISDTAFETEMFGNETPRRRPFSMAAMAAAVLIGTVTLAVIWWGSTAKPAANDQVNVGSMISAEPVAKAEPTIQPQNVTPPVTEETAAEPQSSPADNPKEPSASGVPSTPRTRPTIAEVRPKPETKPAATENSPKPKKKVTVDDLINDN